MIYLRTLSPSSVPVLHLFILVCALSLAISVGIETDNDRQALLCFKSLLSDPAGALSSWSNTSLQFCNWHGVTCSAQPPHHATALDLSSEALTGSISPCIANREIPPRETGIVP